MTNAEKLAKDTKLMATILSQFCCSEIIGLDCNLCPLYDDGCRCMNETIAEKWLESEAKEHG